jgi:uncharacterized protein
MAELILGTVQFGLHYGINNASGKPSDEKVFEMLEYAVSHGITTLDTADSYGNASGLIGTFNQNHPGLFHINTKFISKGDIEKQLESSLHLLHLDKINVFFYHSFNDLTEHPDLLNRLLILKQKQLINKTGISIYTNEEFSVAINTDGIDVIQFPFNLLDNINLKGGLMKLAKEKGKELHVRSVFLQGLFFKSPDSLPVKLTPLKQYLQQISHLSLRFNIAIDKLALFYTLQQKEIDYVIIGVDNLEQLKQHLAPGPKALNKSLVESLNQIAVKETALLSPKNW